MTAPFSTAQEGFNYLESFTNLEKTRNYTARTYRLDRMDILTDLFGRPQDSCRVLHLAGSKGKGSTAAFLARALSDRGFRTGLYTSPHVTGYKERITLAGEEIEEGLFIEEMEKIRATVEALSPETLPGGGEPTTFELLTLLAFLIFRRLGCDWAVYETGLGGRLDATNVVKPEGVFITPIEREHTEFLGETITEIAGEKSGIIKKGVPVFCGLLQDEAMAVIGLRAREQGCDLYPLIDEAPVRQSQTTARGERVNIIWAHGPESRWVLKMAGRHQGENAALAALGLRTLFALRGGFSEEAMARSFASTSLPGRMECFHIDGNPWVLDGAHTPVSVDLTAEAFRKIHGDDGILLFGTVKGKPPEPLARRAAEHFRQILVSRAGDFKPEDPEVVFRAVKAAQKALMEETPSPEAELIPEPEEAFLRARALAVEGRPVLVTGSFYMVSAIRRFLIAHGDSDR